MRFAGRGTVAMPVALPFEAMKLMCALRDLSRLFVFPSGLEAVGGSISSTIPAMFPAPSELA